MPTGCRSLSAALTLSGLLLLQIQPSLQAAPPQGSSQTDSAPLAVLTLVKLAHLGTANAVSGTTVYPGDSLDTGAGGELHLRLAGGQVYLLSDTAVSIGNSRSVLQATLLRGTVGFSSLTDRQFQILAPEGLVEAAYGQPAYGQATITGPNDIVISAYVGALVLHRGDQTLIVKAGQSYYISLVRDEAEGPPQRRAGVAPAYNGHLVWRIVVVSAAAGLGYYLWQFYSVSPFTP